MIDFPTSIPLAGRAYASAGYKLVGWEANGQKGPGGKGSGGWGLRAFRVEALTDQHSIGVNHALSGTACIDVDDLELTRRVFEFVGIDLDELCASTTTYRGRPERRKLLFRTPDPTAKWRGANKLTVNGKTVFELRGAPPGKQVQDVLPPTVHPDTGRPYAFDTRMRPAAELPLLPEQLELIWRDWKEWEPILRQVLGDPAAPPAPPPAPPRAAAAHGSVIEKFNAGRSCANVLERNGYTRMGGRWLRPDSETGAPGVVQLPGGGDYIFSHSAGPLDDRRPHDAFDVMRILEHAGDVRAAVKAAADELGLDRVTKPTTTSKAPPSPAPATTSEPPTMRLQRAQVDFGTLRPQRWVIEGFFPDAEEHTLAGQPGVGKTTKIAGLALVVAGYGCQIGSDLPNDRPRRVLIVSEHAAQYERLFFGYCRRYDLPADEVADRVRLFHAVRLEVTELHLELRHIITECIEAGEEAPLTILDTAASVFALDDENANSEVSAMLAQLKAVIRETESPVWVIAHAAKALGRNDAEITPRGASAFIGDAHGTASIFREEALPEQIFMRSLKCRSVRDFDEIATTTMVDWHEVVDERGVIQRVGIRLGVPRKSGSQHRKSAAAELAEEAREVSDRQLRQTAQEWVRDLIRRRGSAGIYSGSGPSARPAEIAAETAVTAAALKAELRRSSSTAQELMEHLRSWALGGSMDVRSVGCWYVLREKTAIPEDSPASPRIPQGFLKVSPASRGRGERVGGGGDLSPAPPSSPKDSFREEEG